MSVRIVECVPVPHECELPDMSSENGCGLGTLAVCDECNQWWKLVPGDWGRRWDRTSSVAWRRKAETWGGPLAFVVGLAVLGWLFYLIAGVQ